MPETLLDKRASIRMLGKLHREGWLNTAAYQAACAQVRPPAAWFAWAQLTLLLVGSALVLAGVIFFFAYNWAAMGHFLKFGLLEMAILGTLAGTFRAGLDRLSGKILLLSASVMVGVLLAVYGQTYQTGADAFELFAGWAALILGWVLISDFAALWVIWLVLVNTGGILYWKQVVDVHDNGTYYEILFILLALHDGAALVLREVAVQRGLAWLQGRWLRILLLLAPLAALSVPTLGFIVNLDFVDNTHARTPVAMTAALLWVIVSAGSYWVYRRQLRDMTALAMIVINACVVWLTLVGRLLFSFRLDQEPGRLLLMALIILGTATGAVVWLRRTAAVMAAELKGNQP